MVTERQITQMGGTFLTERLKGTIRFAYISARMLGLLLLILGIGALRPCVQAETNGHDSPLTADPRIGNISAIIYRISAINRLRLGTSSLQKIEWRCFFTVSRLKPASSAIS